MNFEDAFIALTQLTYRLRTDPSYMSYVLSTYQTQEHLTDTALAESLGTLPELVVRLALCRRPSSSSATFADDVRRLADYSLTSEAELANILRQVDSFETFSRRGNHDQPLADPLAGLLAAARDRIEPSNESSEKLEDEGIVEE